MRAISENLVESSSLISFCGIFKGVAWRMMQQWRMAGGPMGEVIPPCHFGCLEIWKGEKERDHFSRSIRPLVFGDNFQLLLISNNIL